MAYKPEVRLRKFGDFDWDNQTPSNMPKSPEQKIMELKLLQKQKALIEQQAYLADKKDIIFDMMINLAEQEYQIDIRKNSSPELSNLSEKSKKKLYFLLKNKLENLKIRRDKFFDILRVNHLLIIPRGIYHKTTNSYHRFKKHKNLIKV